ncbi:hypothetical protein KIH79_11785 [Bifidobacterium sp. 82T10]|uniref:Uncharacterized protein n=1 Tax=Bifidobacterium miconis TaxID=2834435 RepID=A0ABS6WHZ7_9BIFI|nr:hypothetical protein [Bifidobacterium miconis]MBW3093587.1 hypothetical protein [Bifidobacterium miconis]
MEKTPQKKRRERIVRIVAGAMAGLVVVGLLLYYVPWPQRIRIDGDAYRADKNAGSDTSYTISLDATRLHYLFQSDRLTGHVTIRPADGGDAVVDQDLDRKMSGIMDVEHPDTGDVVQYFYTSWTDFKSGNFDLILMSGLISTDGKTAFVSIDGKGAYVAPASSEQDAETITNEFGKVFAMDEWIAGLQ